MSTLTAARPTDSLMTSLARSGWGDLSGRSMQGVRSTLRALVDLLPHRSGEGLATAAQIADAAGLSERWVRRCLHLLEDAELIRWTRGGVSAGTPLPSHFRVSKRVLVALIQGARPVLAAIQRQRAERTAQRLAGLSFLRPKQRLRRSVHAALSADPHPQGGGAAHPSPLEMPLHLTDEDAERAARGAAEVRKALAAARRGERQPG